MTNSLCSQGKVLFSTTAGLDLTPTPASFHQEKKKGSLVSEASLSKVIFLSPVLKYTPHGEPNKLDPNKCGLVFGIFLLLFFFFSPPLLWSNLREWEILNPQPLPF